MRREAELGAHVIDASHQEGALIYPLLDAAEGMLDDLAAAVENVGPRRQAPRHAAMPMLVAAQDWLNRELGYDLR